MFDVLQPIWFIFPVFEFAGAVALGIIFAVWREKRRMARRPVPVTTRRD